MKLSNEQLTRLALHTAGINSVLAEAMLEASARTDTGTERVETDIEVDIFVVDDGEKETAGVPDYDPALLVGDWKAGKRDPDLLIFKASPGYMIALGKKPKKGATDDCYLLHEQDGRLCFNAGFGMTFLYYDREADTITLYPGATYERVKTDNR